MSEIEVGEYVRTYEGYIGTLVDVNENAWNYLTIDTKMKIRHDELPETYLYLKNENILKHSKNIIDLIEPKDIIQIKRGLHDDYNFIFICSDEDIITAREIIENYAINILTHEQYERNCYKLEDNK